MFMKGLLGVVQGEKAVVDPEVVLVVSVRNDVQRRDDLPQRYALQ